MFGLKIITSREYNDLKWKLEIAYEFIKDKNEKINSLYEIINEKDEELKKYKSRSKKSGKKTKDDVILLTDVAESPLVEEIKSNEKPKRFIKKTSKPKTQRRVVRKADEK